MSSHPSYEIVVAGYLGVDLTPAFSPGAGEVPLGQLLRPGKLVEVGPLEISAGGVVANTGLALSRWGVSVALSALVGEDPLGDLLTQLLADRGADLYLQRTATTGTAYGLVLAPSGSDRVFLECPGCNAIYCAADLPDDLLARSRLLHFGYPPLMAALLTDGGAELATLLERAQALGVLTSLDMTLPDPDGPAGQVDWPALLARVLPRVDVFVPSFEELLYMLAPEQWAQGVAAAGSGEVIDALPESLPAELADQALELGAGMVLVKAGHRGAVLHTGPRLVLPPSADPALWANCRLNWPACPLETWRVHNACGAGDVAVAAFLTALLQGATPQLAGRLAMIAGRDNLYGPDSISGLRDWEIMLDEASESL